MIIKYISDPNFGKYCYEMHATSIPSPQRSISSQASPYPANVIRFTQVPKTMLIPILYIVQWNQHF
jgi:hypothetical protein